MSKKRPPVVHPQFVKDPRKSSVMLGVANAVGGTLYKWRALMIVLTIGIPTIGQLAKPASKSLGNGNPVPLQPNPQRAQDPATPAHENPHFDIDPLKDTPPARPQFAVMVTQTPFVPSVPHHARRLPASVAEAFKKLESTDPAPKAPVVSATDKPKHVENKQVAADRELTADEKVVALVLWKEARSEKPDVANQTPDGMALVAEIIWNRADKKGVSAYDIVTEASQFTSIGGIADDKTALATAVAQAQATKNDDHKRWVDAQNFVRNFTAGQRSNFIKGATDYYNPDGCTPNWSQHQAKLITNDKGKAVAINESGFDQTATFGHHIFGNSWHKQYLYRADLWKNAVLTRSFADLQAALAAAQKAKPGHIAPPTV